MSGYGKVINGGVAMRKGVTKGINDKLTTRGDEFGRREKVAVAVRDVYKVRTVADQQLNNIDGSKFTKGIRPSKV
jgi:hypothetical protein